MYAGEQALGAGQACPSAALTLSAHPSQALAQPVKLSQDILYVDSHVPDSLYDKLGCGPGEVADALSDWWSKQPGSDMVDISCGNGEIVAHPNGDLLDAGGMVGMIDCSILNKIERDHPGQGQAFISTLRQKSPHVWTPYASDWVDDDDEIVLGRPYKTPDWALDPVAGEVTIDGLKLVHQLPDWEYTCEHEGAGWPLYALYFYYSEGSDAPYNAWHQLNSEYEHMMNVGEGTCWATSTVGLAKLKQLSQSLITLTEIMEALLCLK